MILNTVSLDRLRRGIHLFRARRSWPYDLHNTFYQQLQALTTGPITEQDWSALVHYLSGWRALRPYSKQYMYERGLSFLKRLNEKLRELDNNHAANMAMLSWREVAPLFDCASEIKNVSSPVFASKLCHFLRPNIYTVADQAVVGIGQTAYQQYWQECQAAWNRCEDQELVIAALRTTIGPAIISDFPYVTKIVELCRIGTRHR